MRDLDETHYTGPERRSFALHSIHIWGPGAVALGALLALIFYAWMTDQRIARLEGMVEAEIQMHISLRMEIQTWQAYINRVEKYLIESGFEDVPKPPTPERKTVQRQEERR